MRENKMLATWRAGGQTVGCWLSLANAHTAEVMASLDFDWICVDLQHGLLSYDDLKYMLPAISTGDATPIVRVPWNEPYEIMKALDAGAYGVIVPMVNNREEAEQAVSACRYPPDGLRSFGPIRGALYGGRGYTDEANGQIACIAMVETAEGLDNLDEIASTPGLDAIYIGPADLAYAIGLKPGQFDEPKHQETVLKILAACRDHGIAAGIHTDGLKRTQQRLEQGFNFAALDTDVSFMRRMAASELAEAKQTAQQERENTGY